MIPARGLLLVRPVETNDTRLDGRVLLIAETRERMTANQCEVIAVGRPALCDDEDCERAHFDECEGIRVHLHRVRVGDWLVVRPRSFVAGPEPERAEWFVHQDDVMAILTFAGRVAPDRPAQRARQALPPSVEGQVNDRFNIRVEYKNSQGRATSYDFVQPAFSRETAMLRAEAQIRREFAESAVKMRWRGLVAFVGCRPAEEISE